MALAFRCLSDNVKNRSTYTRDRELREEREKLSKFPVATSSAEQPHIPAPEIFNTLQQPAQDLAAFPTVAECAVHLELLEKFVALKQKVLTSNVLDRVFGIVPKDKLVTKDRKRQVESDATFATRRASKWFVFVRIAAARFLAWSSKCSHFLLTEDRMPDTLEDALPPLGVKQKATVKIPGLRGDSISGVEWSMADMHGSAAERQIAFAEKMTSFLWLRSPAVDGTLKRALVRYERFLGLFKSHPNTLLVPTLDIDLAWHTQQCSPASYRECSSKYAGRFINHDDTLGGATLTTGHKETCRIYKEEFCERYDDCLCWHHEAIKSELEGLTYLGSEDFKKMVKRLQEEVTYYKAVEFAKRKGKPLPARPSMP